MMSSLHSKAFATRYTNYGPRYDVRGDYARLPFQSFWTWVTGKGRPLPPRELEESVRPLSGARVATNVLGSWIAIGAALCIGHSGLQRDVGLPAFLMTTAICWLTVVNRGRSLQATFHYMSHGSAMPNRSAAIWTTRVSFTTPFLYADWRSYVRSHVSEHHHVRVLCTDVDPDRRFIESNGLYPGISEQAFWWRIWLRPFAPDYIAARQWESLRASLIDAPPGEVLFRLVFWSLVIGVCAFAGLMSSLLWLYAVPAFVLLHHSLWLQLITEHLWFARRAPSSNPTAEYGGLTWGRFQGRRLPTHGTLAWTAWWARLLLCDLPVRLYVYPKDLPNHDFHHRLPVAPYHRIADIRATHEACEGRFGPLLEVWGFVATLRVMRDHLCHCDTHPFRFISNHYIKSTNNMQTHIEKAQGNLQSMAYAWLSAHDLFSEDEIAFMARACADVPKELIRVGDVGEQNNLDVGRFMEDKKEVLPVYRNEPTGRQVVDMLNEGKCRELLSGLMGGEYYIRRCQVNVLREGSFIGKHIDTYSNLDYRYSCVIQFGESYDGGEFFTEVDGVDREIKTGYADFLVNSCEIPHGVRTVTGGNRTSLVFFLSEMPLSVPNTNHKQI